MVGAAQMNVMSWIGLGLAVVLGVYLVVALLFPERFE
jgi:K+-transporting ATPase KdpF subunit